jgi:cyanophycinase-like exopeptidase
MLYPPNVAAQKVMTIFFVGGDQCGIIKKTKNPQQPQKSAE